jgi:hypothetical protein
MGLTMFNNDFDPYDQIMQMSQRLLGLQDAHNNLGRAFERSERDLSVALEAIRNLQQSHAHLNSLVFELLNKAGK